jgi:hypothetical protein
MIDVGAKPKTERVAVARGFVSMSRATVGRVRRGDVEKGDVLAAARLAGIMAAKKTPDLVPLCHPVALSAVTRRRKDWDIWSSSDMNGDMKKPARALPDGARADRTAVREGVRGGGNARPPE